MVRAPAGSHSAALARMAMNKPVASVDSIRDSFIVFSRRRSRSTGFRSVSRRARKLCSCKQLSTAGSNFHGNGPAKALLQDRPVAGKCGLAMGHLARQTAWLVSAEQVQGFADGFSANAGLRR